MSDRSDPPELSTVPDAAWAEARGCFPVIQRLANTQGRTRAQVIAAAGELGFSCTQVYERLGRFLADPRLTSLLPRNRGPIRGRARLPSEINQLIDEAIETLYLTRQRPKLIDLVTEIRRRCRAAGLNAPSRKAVTARIKAQAAPRGHRKT
jgi:putative transposase